MNNCELNNLEKQEMDKIIMIKNNYDLNNIDVMQKILENNNFKTEAGENFINFIQQNLEREKKKYSKINRPKNKIASAIKIIGIILIILSIFFYISTEGEEIGLSLILVSIINCIFIFGFSEIIQILHDIRRNNYKK